MCIAGASRLQAKRPSCQGSDNVFYVDEQVVLWKHLKSFLGPLDDTDAVAIQIVLEPQVGDFLDIVEAVEVNVIQGESSMILSQDYERRTEGIFFDIESLGDALYQTGLARAQLTREQEDIGFLGQFSKVVSQKLGLLGAIGL